MGFVTKSLKFLLVLIVIVVITDRITGYFLFTNDSPLTGIRNYLLSDNSAPRYLAQPYVNYINHPDYISLNGENQINNLGLRNPTNTKIPKPAGTLRVLFLGGSTTYGEVDNAGDAFPALIEKAISDSISLHPLAGFSSVECLNAGMGAATTAEMLTQYLFKYKYLDADIVVIHTGINDAFATASLPGYVYQPDYHTVKRIMENPHPATPFLRLVAHSYIASLFIGKTYYSAYTTGHFTNNEFLQYHSNFLWLDNGNEKKFHPATNAFYNNLTELVRSIHASGKKILLVTEVLMPEKMNTEMKDMLADGLEPNRLFMLRVAKENNTAVCDLQKCDFPDSVFVDADGIHLTVAGEKIKAKKIEPVLWLLLQQIGLSNR
ncbi:MAG: SGNH/GDSL hydrolase family protein [Chitinophagales bacterium]|nr:SGNH/GDSL hydrolase family protein [Chitinophagales bacterium]